MIRPLQFAALASLGLLLLLPGPALAQQQLADVENLGDTLVFHPLVEFAELVLTVTGPCDFQYRQRVTQGEPIFRLDPTTIDGVYRFDLVRIERIDPGIVEILQQARKKADEETPRQLCREGLLPPPPTAQSEGFVVSRGEIIYDPKAVEESAAKGALTPTRAGLSAASGGAQGGLENMAAADFVIIDDLIVDGSACIGFDCVNGESFGFDTIRLKENNLRIKFDDTSTAASFPRNDWQITANDSANGGLSKFSIDDISGSRTPFTIEANARSHSLYVDDGGRIGSRTSTPSTEIHTIDGDTPTLRLQQDGSSGFAPQTWDVAGNETNFFIRDVTNGSTLPFRIRPGAPSSAIDIASDGDVGIGTASPSSSLHVRRTNATAKVTVEEASGTAAQRTLLQLTNNGGTEFRMTDSSTSVTWLFQNTSGNFRFTDAGDATNEFILDPSGNLTITGSLTVGPGGCTGCDLVFDPSYKVESIEDHAAYMWANSHLPGVGPTPEDAPMNLSRKTGGILNELEKAHIYIEQLNSSLKEKEAEIAALRESQEADIQLRARVAELEAAIQQIKDSQH